MDKILDGLRKIVHRPRDSSDDYVQMSSKYVPVVLDKNNFHTLLVDKSDIGNSIMFVDGGQAIICETAGFCVGLIRVASVKYVNNKRVERKLEEFFVLITEVDGVLSVSESNGKFDDLVFDSQDSHLAISGDRASPSRVVSIIRRFAELELAFRIANNYDYIILDGTLDSRYPYEQQYLKQLLATGKVCALSKTCSLTMKSGIPVTKRLGDICPSGVWRYFPIVENNNSLHDADIYFVKLHSKSNHIFRFEVCGHKGFNNVDYVLSLLALNSVDPIFLGYPYGFVDVDQAARIGDDELRLLRGKFFAKLGKDSTIVNSFESSLDAHSILDKIKF